MATSGFTGISYPFRVNSRGGCSMSSTSATDASHITESLTQIFGTNFLERPMEGGEVYTTVATLLFEPNNIALQQVLKNRMAQDIARLEPRVQCSEDDISFAIETENGIDFLYAHITFKVIKYNTTFTEKIKVGELSHE